MEHIRQQNRGRILLIYNPNGVVDQDIYLAAQKSPFQIMSCKMEVSQTAEGHTIEKINLLDLGTAMLSQNPDYVLTINGAGLDNEGFLAYSRQ